MTSRSNQLLVVLGLFVGLQHSAKGQCEPGRCGPRPGNILASNVEVIMSTARPDALSQEWFSFDQDEFVLLSDVEPFTSVPRTFPFLSHSGRMIWGGITVNAEPSPNPPGGMLESRLLLADASGSIGGDRYATMASSLQTAPSPDYDCSSTEIEYLEVRNLFHFRLNNQTGDSFTEYLGEDMSSFSNYITRGGFQYIACEHDDLFPGDMSLSCSYATGSAYMLGSLGSNLIIYNGTAVMPMSGFVLWPFNGSTFPIAATGMLIVVPYPEADDPYCPEGFPTDGTRLHSILASPDWVGFADGLETSSILMAAVGETESEGGPGDLEAYHGVFAIVNPLDPETQIENRIVWRIVKEGDDVPECPGTSFDSSSFLDATTAGGETVVFSGEFNDALSNRRHGIWMWRPRIECSAFPRGFRKAVVEFDEVPAGSGTWRLTSLRTGNQGNRHPLVLNARDEVFFSGVATKYDGDEPERDGENNLITKQGIWKVGLFGNIESVVLSGDDAPGTVLKFRDLGGFASNRNGDLAFRATVDNETETDARFMGVWLVSGNHGCEMRRVMVGQFLGVDGLPAGDTVTLPDSSIGYVSSVGFQAGSGGSDGRIMALNDRGEMALLLEVRVIDNETLSYSKPAIAILHDWKTCREDWNQDGNVDQDDVAALVNCVSGNPDPDYGCCDIDGDGNSDQNDIAYIINAVAGFTVCDYEP